MNEFIFTKRLVSERAVLFYIYILRIFVIVVAFFFKSASFIKWYKAESGRGLNAYSFNIKDKNNG